MVGSTHRQKLEIKKALLQNTLLFQVGQAQNSKDKFVRLRPLSRRLKNTSLGLVALNANGIGVYGIWRNSQTSLCRKTTHGNARKCIKRHQ